MKALTNFFKTNNLRSVEFSSTKAEVTIYEILDTKDCSRVCKFEGSELNRLILDELKGEVIEEGWVGYDGEGVIIEVHVPYN